MANDFTGRQLRIDTTGTISLANFKVDDGVWTGGTPADVFTLTDVAGRSYSWTFPTDGSEVRIGRLGWMSGPVVITAIPHGIVLLYLGTR